MKNEDNTVLSMGKRKRKFDKIRNWIYNRTEDSSMIEKFLSEDVDEDYDIKEDEIIALAMMEYVTNKFDVTKRELCVLLLKNFLTDEEISTIIGNALHDDLDKVCVTVSRAVRCKACRKIKHPRNRRIFREIFEEDTIIEDLRNQNIMLVRELNELRGIKLAEVSNELYNIKHDIDSEFGLRADLLNIVISPWTKSDCVFSTRTFNCLDDAGIRTLRDLLKYGYKNLFQIPCMGKKSVEELETYFLNNYEINIKKLLDN